LLQQRKFCAVFVHLPVEAGKQEGPPPELKQYVADHDIEEEKRPGPF
jgi:hypothetical protein